MQSNQTIPKKPLSLKEAIESSPISAAYAEYNGYIVHVREGEVPGYYDLSFCVGMMPPHWQRCDIPMYEVKEELENSFLPGDIQFYPLTEEDV